jgi:mono/diheme cytochrome c family protein
MPRPILYVLLILTALTLVPLAFIAKARVTTSPRPRIQVVPDMDNQPTFRPQASSAFFADGRAMRPTVAGTVARGELPADASVQYGRPGGLPEWLADQVDNQGEQPGQQAGQETGQDEDWVATIPVPVTAELMVRGRERFDIFCAACHGLTGDGNGVVSVRATQLAEGTWTPPTDLTSDLVVERAAGHLFNTITHGLRNMPAYGDQVPVADRWAIIAYLRALQRSVRGTWADVPDEDRTTLK